MKDVEPQNETRDDDDSFNGDYFKSDKKNIYVSEPREKEDNGEEMVIGNHKGSPNGEGENVPEVFGIEVGVDAISNIESFRKKKPLEGEKEHKSRTEERATLSDCKQIYPTLYSAYIDKIIWFKNLASQLGGEIEETNPVNGKEAPDINSKENTPDWSSDKPLNKI